ncbi:tyrosine-type recombinase/integrase [Rhodococcus jostii]|uniref:tyrosine-type recombinase/integrase n=1 Tax=Rhodococcus jostii TaxID=132919 RepID=UPI00362BE9D8
MTAKRNRRAGIEDRWKRVDGSPSANAGKGKRWRARYVDDQSREHSQGFDRKVDAQKWLDSIVSSQVTGNYIDPARGKVTFASFYTEWSARQLWETNTRESMNLVTRSVPFGDVALSDLRHSHFESWIKSMQDRPLAPRTIRTRLMNVRSVLKAAMRDRALASDPSQGVKLPRIRRAEMAMQIPTSTEIGRLIGSAPDAFSAFIALCAFAGLRSGEAAALQVGDFDFLRREIKIERQSQRVRSGVVEIRRPKYGSERVLSAPSDLLDLVAEHMRLRLCDAGDPKRWLFPGLNGNPMEANMVGTRWRKTRVAAGVDFHLHALRHYFASGLIHAGCDVVTVQRALGHASASVTLDTYSHLWPKAADRTRQAAAGLFSEALRFTADAMRTDDTV